MLLVWFPYLKSCRQWFQISRDSLHVRESNTVLDYSTPWIPDSRYWISDLLSVDLGFRNPIVGSIPATRKITRIPNSTSKNFRISLQWAIGIIDGQTDRENKKILCSLSEWLSYSVQNCLLIALFFQPNLPRKSSVKPRKGLFISNPSDWSA